VLQRSGASERELVLQSLINETSCLRQLHRDSDLPKVQEQIDAMQGIKSQSIEPRTRWQGLMALLNHTFDTAQRNVLLQQALVEAEKLGPGRELDETLELLAVTGASPDQAEAYMKQAVSVSEQASGKESPQVAHDLENLATALWSEKKENEAEAARRRAIAILEKLPERKAELSLAEQHLADVYRGQQRFAEAESLYLRSVQAAETSSAPTAWVVSIAVERVATLYKEWGKPEQAVPYYIRAVKLEEAHPNLDPSLLFDLESLSEILRKLNRAEEAKTYDEQRKQIIDQQIAKRVASPPAQ
jgi:tetratricopeptide (TPR) repeat protein